MRAIELYPQNGQYRSIFELKSKRRDQILTPENKKNMIRNLNLYFASIFGRRARNES